MYCQKLDSQVLDPASIRLFFGGVELANTNFLYQYYLKDGFTLNVLQKQVIKEEAEDI